MIDCSYSKMADPEEEAFYASMRKNAIPDAQFNFESGTGIGDALVGIAELLLSPQGIAVLTGIITLIGAILSCKKARKEKVEERKKWIEWNTDESDQVVDQLTEDIKRITDVYNDANDLLYNPSVRLNFQRIIRRYRVNVDPDDLATLLQDQGARRDIAQQAAQIFSQYCLDEMNRQ